MINTGERPSNDQDEAENNTVILGSLVPKDQPSLSVRLSALESEARRTKQEFLAFLIGTAVLEAEKSEKDILSRNAAPTVP